MNRLFTACTIALLASGVTAWAATPLPSAIQSCSIAPEGADWRLAAGGGSIKVHIDAPQPDVGVQPVLDWVCNAASAVSTYYGRFPVLQAQVDVRSRRRDGIGGTTWGGHPGVQGAYTRMTLGQNTSLETIREDWTMTHELTHMAFPQLPENQHWAEEGMATYLEPIERVQARTLSAAKVWHDMYRDMQQGEPQANDLGLNNTHTWARTYWGGALFWFAADVEIYRQSGGKKTLRDAMRAIVNAGGSIERDGSLVEELAVGDKATGTTVLIDAYRAQADKPQSVDLDAIWKAIGVNGDGRF